MINTIRELNKPSKAILTTALVFIAYGYFCRLIDFYFFWESKSIGWAILLIGIIFLLRNKLESEKKKKRNIVPHKIGIGIIIFILLLQTFLLCLIPTTDAFSVAKKFLSADSSLRSEIGIINGYRLIPMGSIKTKSGSNGNSGSATIILTVHGEKKYKDLTIYVIKYVDRTEWEVKRIE